MEQVTLTTNPATTDWHLTLAASRGQVGYQITQDGEVEIRLVQPWFAVAVNDGQDEYSPLFTAAMESLGAVMVKAPSIQQLSVIYTPNGGMEAPILQTHIVYGHGAIHDGYIWEGQEYNPPLADAFLTGIQHALVGVVADGGIG